MRLSWPALAALLVVPAAAAALGEGPPALPVGDLGTLPVPDLGLPPVCVLVVDIPDAGWGWCVDLDGPCHLAEYRTYIWGSETRCAWPA